MFDPALHSAAIDDFRKDAEARYPEEACGFLTDKGYVSCANMAAKPTEDFEINPATYLKVAASQTILALVHSHPDGPDFPTYRDMKSQIASALPWGITVVTKGGSTQPFFWGDQIARLPLVGRVFRHGVTDCFAIIRDYHYSKGIMIGECPRDDKWWDKEGFDLYMTNLKPEGFDIIDKSQVKEGDCFLISIRSKVINHAGVYVGNGMGLHHLQGYLSRNDPIGRWGSKIVHWVRHKDMR